MAPQKNDNERDAILTAFIEECPEPNADQVIAWLDRHPLYADDILDETVELLLNACDRRLGLIRELTAEEKAAGRKRSEEIFRQVEAMSSTDPC